MTVTPDRRLLLAVAGWTAGALAVVLLPALWLPLAGAGVVLLLVVGSDARRLRALPPVVAERRLPERAFLGREARIAIVVRNASPLPLELELLEELPRDLAGEDPAFPCVRVGPGAAARLEYAVVPERRGDRALGELVALVRSPLGLLRRRQRLASADVLSVYPDTTRFLRREALDPLRLLSVIGVRPTQRRGEGSEFDALREYVPGDDPRHLDWRATARRGRPIVRQLRHEARHAVVIAVDASRLMAARSGAGSKLDHAIDAALALGFAALGCGDRVGMLVFDRELRGFAAPHAGRRDLGHFVELLRGVEPRMVEADYEALLRGLARRQRQRALVVVLTDFVEAAAARLAAPLVVMARRHRVLLVALRERVYAEVDSPPPAAERPDAFYRRLVLDDLLRERETALAQLRRQGLQTLDLYPEEVIAPLLNRYLALRYGADR